MSDARLRTLERRWHEAGTVEAEAAYRVAQLHAGRLPAELPGLELAAFLEHPAAFLAVHGTLPQRLRRIAALERIVRDYQDTEWRIARAAERQIHRTRGWPGQHPPWQLFTELRAFGQQACVRAGIVAIRRTLPPGIPAPPVLVALEAWADCPCRDHARAVSRSRKQASKVPVNTLDACRRLGRAVAEPPRWRIFSRAVLDSCHSVSPRGLSRGIRKALLPWAIGEHVLLRRADEPGVEAVT